MFRPLHAESHKEEKSYLGGLLGSTNISNTTTEISTGTEALAGLDLSLISGGDTTLIGSQLSAGGNLNIVTGGDLNVLAAIDSERKESFSQDLGPIVMTTITEQSYKEIANLVSLIAGGQISVNVGGDTNLGVYEYEGKPGQNLADLYPKELLQQESLKIIQQILADDYYYDKETQLSPAFKAVLTIAVGTVIMPGLGLGGLLGLTGEGALSAAANAAVNSFTSSLIVNSLDAAVSGKFDFDEILKNAAVAGITAGLTSGLGLGDFIDFGDGPWNTSLIGALGNGNLTLPNLMEGAFDGLISSGISSIAYGTNFGASLSAALIGSLTQLALADAQFEIGELGLDEGSLGHALLHGLAGCIAAEAQGNSCAAGMAGGIASSLYASTLEGTTLSDKEQRQRAELIGAFAGYLLSEGQADNVYAASTIAISALANNRQIHRTEVEWISENANAFIEWMCPQQQVCDLTLEKAIGILTATTLAGVSDAFAIYGGDPYIEFKDKAREFRTQNYNGPSTLDGQTIFGQLDKNSSEYLTSLLNAETALNNLVFYDYADQATRWPQGQGAVVNFINEALKDFGDAPRSVNAAAFITALQNNSAATAAIFTEYGASQIRKTDGTFVAAVGFNTFLNSLSPELRNTVATAYAQGTLGQVELTPEQIETAVTQGIWGATVDFIVGEGFIVNLADMGIRITTIASGARVFTGANGKTYGDVTDAIESIAPGATNIEFLPKGTRFSANQIETNISQQQAIDALVSNGYNKSLSQDGSVTILKNGYKTYSFMHRLRQHSSHQLL
ncbi:DUF637 domain-containing protein [Brucella intermedia]|uniref:DUF637 domain-containing protein n=1 Tax=Brucella intermedia TaxID=94625 RepID=UPI00124D3C24|nr:DUF637 domain-containing protein [Brucella intermedia]KAB2721490.1 hypothetical protein F9L02_23080 [Brucella intermedia]